MNIRYRCKGYSVKLKMCKHHYVTSSCPTFVYGNALGFRGYPYTCEAGIIEVDWTTNIIKQNILKECYNKI